MLQCVNPLGLYARPTAEAAGERHCSTRPRYGASIRRPYINLQEATHTPQSMLRPCEVRQIPGKRRSPPIEYTHEASRGKEEFPIPRGVVDGYGRMAGPHALQQETERSSGPERKKQRAKSPRLARRHLRQATEDNGVVPSVRFDAKEKRFFTSRSALFADISPQRALLRCTRARDRD